MRTLSPRNRSNRSNGKAADKAATVASAVDTVLGAPTAPIAPPVTPAPTAPTDATAPTARQLLADGGKAATVALSDAVARKALLAAVGTVKRSDLATDAAHNTSRALERLRRADLKALARRIDRLADFVATADGASDADLKGANVSTRAGSVSVAALINALADASSKADALALFAAA